MANYFEEYCARIRRGGARGVTDKPVAVDQDGTYTMTYVPFEHRNDNARLVLVSTTPGHTHVALAASVTEELIRARAPGRTIQRENKRRVELGGRLVRPNLIRMLDHFRVPELIGQPHAAALWNDGFDLIQPLALLPFATTRHGLAFNGPLDELIDVPMLRAIFDAHFLDRLAQCRPGALYIGLGRTAWAGLRHAAGLGLLDRLQLLGMMPVPAKAGSMVRYFLREITERDLSPNDPVRHRIAWLDAAHEEMEAGVRRLRTPPSPANHPDRLTA
ncbi:hypothetical protein SAMN05216345_1082 [Cupriavidus sp. YR651]|uniref:hypothetical protein n=1 Tax=Cupriavidus sp. YR651 TaxID=1855315 RepID=UPI00088FD253|nr:hypothetical protein [Cupriavidus sp. YR651]SDD33787.1 hypothetical protein SAMN05216345_1082 [Cupriavidus sp. YR651]